MYDISETVEHGELCVTYHPSIWARNNILLWPPPGSVVEPEKIVTPGPDWTSHGCRVLKDNIETVTEAKELEKMYSKHRDSNSFRKEKDRKKYKRDHPVNANVSNLIDVNDLMKQIDNDTEKSSLETARSNVAPAAKSSKQEKHYHKQCVQQSEQIVKKAVFSGVKGKHPNAKNSSKSQISKRKKSKEQDSHKGEASRYQNYLKSGKKTIVPTSTITKAEYLKLNGENTDEKAKHLRENIEQSPDAQETLDFDAVDYGARGTQFSSTPQEIHSRAQGFSFFRGSENNVEQNNDNIGEARSDYIPKIDIIDKILIKEGGSSSTNRSGSFEENVLKSINELKSSHKRSEEQRLLFEARMIIKFDAISNEMRQKQDRRGHKQDVEAVQHEIDPVNPVNFGEDDFEELDQQFPIKVKRGVEDLEWNLRHDLEFKFRLKSRVNEFIAGCPKKTIRLILKYLVRDDVLEHYCWNGTSKKRVFKDLKHINKFLFSIISENFKKFKKLQYTQYMGQWLKQAKGRQRIITYTYANRRDDSDADQEDDNNQDDDDEDSD